MAVRENHEYCPPHGMNASLYVRPVLFGSGPQLGLKPAAEYTFLVFVVPIGGTPPKGVAVAPRRRLTDCAARSISEHDKAATTARPPRRCQR